MKKFFSIDKDDEGTSRRGKRWTYALFAAPAVVLITNNERFLASAFFSRRAASEPKRVGPSRAESRVSNEFHRSARERFISRVSEAL